MLIVKINKRECLRPERFIYAAVRHAQAIEALQPVIKGRIGWHTERTLMNFIRPVAAFLIAGHIEEGHVCAGSALVIGKKQVVRADVILVDGLFDESHAQYVGEKVINFLGTAGDG